MKLSDFDYHLSKELIAQYPLLERDSARLLVVDRASGKIEHKIFKDIAGYLKKDDLLVLNDTKVRKCRLKGKRKSGGKVEVFLLKHKGGLIFEAMIKPARIKTGEKIIFPGSAITCALIARNVVKFDARSEEEVYGLGVIPLPPYIKREAEEQDSQYYQTVYARENGSVASPTAGLHFTPELLTRIQQAGTEVAYVTLHVGHATFKPVSADDITQHKMGLEFFTISPETQKKLFGFKKKGLGRVIAVGTTSCRTLETYAAGQTEGSTELFIYPGYKFRMVNGLLTNFHLPKTTLFMLVCAFCGEELAKKAYALAIKEKYRFYSYGDAMLII
ncbi:MAG: tRNA preQ1(34) S-adenosylmethionine ribosyltransferase-isomerase QueA [Candidatus Omnitrophica bacterium]|nr:tRNA preQ1(34) S-adenosylmethionine ribosyltransferase-isomerase QueA [Candidatus Omnitrophota bacterium]